MYAIFMIVFYIYQGQPTEGNMRSNEVFPTIEACEEYRMKKLPVTLANIQSDTKEFHGYVANCRKVDVS